MAFASARKGNSRTAFAASSSSTATRSAASKPTRSRLDPMSTVPDGVDSTTPEVCSAPSPDPTAPT
ncbi:hypothetical protein BFL35_13155 [Clavibacter michiganensis]|nr:hypothetical protein BFL35_13155 [Clavibacter michiganensis]